MKYRKVGESDGVRHFAIVFSVGDEASKGLVDIARRERIFNARFTALGAFERCTIAFFDLATKRYENTEINEQVEVMSLVGNIAIFEGEPKLHAHVVIGRRDGTAHGGHFVSGYVQPTLEVSLTAFDAPLERATDDATGLPLLDLDAK
jgi:predicted DNA-binding protein with PD1-like motif